MWLKFVLFVHCLPYFCLSEEHEERSMIEPHSREDPKLKELVKVWNFLTIKRSL